jgi:hypothetical protein
LIIQLTLPVTPYPGSELTIEPFRWDQRVFSILLQIGATQTATTNSNANAAGFTPMVNNTTYTAMSDVTGGNISLSDFLSEPYFDAGFCQIVSNYRMLIQLMDNLLYRIQQVGIVANFEALNPSTQLPLDCKHKMIYVR